MPKKLPPRIKFVESITHPEYGYVLPILGMIAIEKQIGLRIVRNWNAIQKLVENGKEADKLMCFACVNFDVENDSHTIVCTECIRTNGSKFQQ